MRDKFILMAKNIAYKVAENSQDPHKKVGAVILAKNGRVLSVGYNGLIEGKNPSKGFWENRDFRRPFIIHAEVNAFSCISRYDEPFLIYVTLLPCGHCANLIACYGIKNVVYSEEYASDTSAKKIFKYYNISCKKI